MNSSLYTGVLGLKNHQIRMDVIGNNIANVNTYGFKQGRATFEDLLSRTYYAASAPTDTRGGINPLQVGMGMTVASITNIMTQGQVEMTGRITDVAIDGNGWFILQDGAGDTVYTRDGTFGLDKEGSLVNASGYYVQGWSRVTTDNDHNFSVDTQRPVDDINFQVGEKMQAAATNKVGLKCNLDEHTRSLIADGIDPKEGFATTNDLLVDLYDADNTNPSHLGIREGDWVEIKVDVAYDENDLKGQTTATLGAANETSQTYTAVLNNTSQTIYSYTGWVDESFLPMTDDGTIALPAGFTRAYVSPQQLAEMKAGGTTNTYTIDPESGVVYATNQMQGESFTFQPVKGALNTLPLQTEKYMYFQVSNDSTIGDLENSINAALKAVDENGTLAAECEYDDDEAKFVIYNKNKPGTLDYNNVHVEISAVSGSGIRRGYLLRESTDPTVAGTRLGVTAGSLGGKMTREVVGRVDYQTSSLKLDYGNINGSAQVYGQVTRSNLQATYAAGTVDLNVATAGDWSGYTAGGTLQMIDGTASLTVDGTTWTKVNVFTGASNEYRISTTAGSDIPAVIFNTADSRQPNVGQKLVFSYDTKNAQNKLLVAGTDYTIDSTTGSISLAWNNSTSSAVMGTSTGLTTGGGFTGTVRVTADYTTEDRAMVPPNSNSNVDDNGIATDTVLMDNRWADYAYELASTNEGGAGHARTSFINMFSSINATRTATTGFVADEGISTQPTSVSSTRFQSAETYRTSIDVYDSLGDTHTLQFIFTHVGSNYDLTAGDRNENRWYWRAELPYEDVFSFDSLEFKNGNTSTAKINGELEFTDEGLIKTMNLGTNSGPIIFDPSPIGMNGVTSGAVDDVSISINWDGHGSPIDGVTQFASDFTTKVYEQNGWAMGVLETFAVDSAGVIQGKYSNNVVKPIAQIALAMFPNEEGLTKEGNNVFSMSANTGLASIVAATVGGAGQITGGALEQSNVDITDEFTDMIITERGFQANSRIITTSDEMLMEVINLKR